MPSTASMNPDNKMPPPLPDLDLVFVQGGDFRMGMPEDDSYSYSWEHPVHKVTVPSFYMARYPVTQRLWQAVMGDNPSRFQGEKRPVENVSWDDIQAFLEKLNAQPEVQRYLEQLDLPDGKFRLPSEAEWEFAARGGMNTNGFKYAGSNKLKEVGWYDENSYNETKPVGLKFPNELGLYDMSGNIWEWCEDDWHYNNYKGAPEDGNAWVNAPERGDYRVNRGGSYFLNPGGCSSSSRLYDSPWYRGHLGFRLALSPQ